MVELAAGASLSEVGSLTVVGSENSVVDLVDSLSGGTAVVGDVELLEAGDSVEPGEEELTEIEELLEVVVRVVKLLGAGSTLSVHDPRTEMATAASRNRV